MKKQAMSNVDYHFALAELRALEGGWFSKAYDAPGGLRLKFNAGGEVNVAIEWGVRLHKTRFVDAPSETQSSFVQLLRKELDNARVEKVEQLSFDRVVSFTLAKAETYQLVFEQFGKGNAILVQEGIIVRPMLGHDYSSRKLRKGEKYVLPPSEKKHPAEVTVDFVSSLSGEAVPSLAKAVNAPPFYLEEACARAEVGFREDLGKIDAGKRIKLAKEVVDLVSQPVYPTVYFENGLPSVFSAFGLEKLTDSGLEARRFGSFSQALDEYYINFRQAAVTSESSDRAGRLEHTLKELEAKAVELEAEEASATSAGQWIQANFEKVEAALEAARKEKKNETKLTRS